MQIIRNLTQQYLVVKRQIHQKRTSGTVQTSNPFADIEAVFGGWTPVYYTKESSTVALEEDLVIEGEATSGTTLEAVFSLGRQ